MKLTLTYKDIGLIFEAFDMLARDYAYNDKVVDEIRRLEAKLLKQIKKQKE